MNASDRRGLPGWIFWPVLLLLAIGHAVWSWQDAKKHSPTFDEPMHALGAFMHLHRGDFRINPEDPPLWHYWAAMAWGDDRLEIDPYNPQWVDCRSRVDLQWAVTIDQLIDRPELDPIGFVMAMKRRMVAIGAMLVFSIGVVGRWILSRFAPYTNALALLAAFLCAVEANFLAHSAMLKNDVGLTLTWLWMVVGIWWVGRRISVPRIALLGLTCAACATMKFSGVLVAPAVVLALLARACIPTPWRVGSRVLRNKSSRLLAAGAVCLIAALMTWVGVWAAYGFRYRAIPEPDRPLGFQYMDEKYTAFVLNAESGGKADLRNVEVRSDDFTKLVHFARENRLLPEAYLFGIYYVQATGLARWSYLLGDYSVTGWWYYFPVAIFLKTPTFTLILLLVALRQGAIGLFRRRINWRDPFAWTLTAFGVPMSVYLLMAMGSNLNLGVRHVLTIYPAFYIGISLAIGSMLLRARPNRRIVIGACAAMAALWSMIEVAANSPHHLAFFNQVVGGRSNGINLLGDSNLDWGQDLPAMAEWQKKHPDYDLYFSYFGTMKPELYGIRYMNIEPGYTFVHTYEPFHKPAPGRKYVFAYSATHLQAIYSEDLREQFRYVRAHKEKEIVGASIYLYDDLDVNRLPARR